MYPDVSDFVSTGQVSAIGAHFDTPDRVNHFVKVEPILHVCLLDQLTIFTPIELFGLEVIIRGLRGCIIRIGGRLGVFAKITRDENHVAHVFAVGVLGEALVNLLVLLIGYGRVDIVPESDGAIRGARHELCQ